MCAENAGYWIAFNRVTGIGPARLRALLEQCGTIERAWSASVQELRAARLDRTTIEALLEARRAVEPQREVERIKRAGVTVYTWDDPEYPDGLRTIDRSPPVLYVRGALAPQDELAVAVVGTRHASVYGREVAHSLGAALAQNGITVVSGLALGVDTVAHRAALDAGGRTIAVLGSGVDELYPAQNRALGENIAGQGAIVSDYALGTKPDARNFPPRNRIISALSRAVVIVEAGARSGALITAEFAAEQGRELFAVPGSILNAGSVGCNNLIRDGATPLLSIDDVLNYLDMERAGFQRAVRAAIPAEPDEARVLAELGSEPRHMDEVVRAAGLPSAQVSSLLVVMEIKGLVRQSTPMHFVRA
jgi:DNA processing protein